MYSSIPSCLSQSAICCIATRRNRPRWVQNVPRLCIHPCTLKDCSRSSRLPHRSSGRTYRYPSAWAGAIGGAPAGYRLLPLRAVLIVSALALPRHLGPGGSSARVSFVGLSGLWVRPACSVGRPGSAVLPPRAGASPGGAGARDAGWRVAGGPDRVEINLLEVCYNRACRGWCTSAPS